MGKIFSMNYLTRKRFSISVVLALLLLFSFHQLVTFFWCRISAFFTYDSSCFVDREFSADVAVTGLALIILTLPCLLILFFLADRVFDRWKWFALFAIPIVLTLTFIIGRMRGGGGVGVVGFHPGLILLPVLYGVYFITSFAIIIVTAIRERRERKQN